MLNSTYQNSKQPTPFFSVKHLVTLSMFTALTVVARLSFSWLPNITPVTVLVLLICRYWGLLDAVIIANLMVVATGVYLGMGVWIVEQMIAYTIILSLFAYVTQFRVMRYLVLQAILAFILAMVYGFIMSLGDAFIYRINLWIYYSAGVIFDLMHASGSFLFMLVLQKPLAILKSHKLFSIS